MAVLIEPKIGIEQKGRLWFPFSMTPKSKNTGKLCTPAEDPLYMTYTVSALKQCPLLTEVEKS